MKREAPTDPSFLTDLPAELDPFLIVGRLPSGVLFVAIEEVLANSFQPARVIDAVATAVRLNAGEVADALAAGHGYDLFVYDPETGRVNTVPGTSVLTVSEHRKGSSHKM